MGFRGWIRGWGQEAIHRIQKRVAFSGLEGRNPTLVYQMGKVGSSTVARTLEQVDVPGPVIHLHHLNPEKVRENIHALRENPGYLHEHVVTSLTLLNQQLEWGHFPCDIITLTREPVGRTISFTFQDWKRQLSGVDSLQELEPDRMIELVTKKLQPDSFHADPGRWFERELKSVFGIDAMAVPYDFEQGYVKISRGPVDVLVIRMEDLNCSLASGLAELYDAEERDIQMVRANVGKKKRYAALLEEVKEKLTLPPEISEHLWSTDYVQHFYGPDTERLREKWGEPS